jgi:hypothetical protein
MKAMREIILHHVSLSYSLLQRDQILEANQEQSAKIYACKLLHMSEWMYHSPSSTSCLSKGCCAWPHCILVRGLD